MATMNEVLKRAPCFKERDFTTCQDLTLPERQWWRRASDAQISGNLEEALNVVQESRAGRYIRGFVLDPELALLDEEISGMMERHFGVSSMSTRSSAKLPLEQLEREKLTFQMMMEKFLLRTCTRAPSFKESLQRSGSGDGLKGTCISPRSATSDRKTTEEAFPIASQRSTTPLCTTPEVNDGLTAEMACPVVPQIRMSPRCVTPEVSDAITPEKPSPVVPQISMSTSCITPELSDSKIPEKAISVVSQISLTSTIQEFTFGQTAMDVGLQTSIVTPLPFPKKMGFRKRVRSVFSKIGRVIGSGCCCGRRQAEE